MLKRLKVAVEEGCRRTADLIQHLRYSILKVLWRRQSTSLLVDTSGPPACDLAVCAIFKDEATHLQEWIEFHRLVGVEKFFLYNNISSDCYRSVLAPYLRSGLVELCDWKMRPGQMSAYNHCLIRNGSRAHWIAFIDLDEFLFPVQSDDLRDVLHDYEAFAGVAVHWVFFGSSGHINQPQGLVIENFVQSRGQPNPHVKLIVQPPQTKWMSTPHEGLFWNEKTAVDETKSPVLSARPMPPVAEYLRINHYWSKSVEEFLTQKLHRGRADTLRKDQRHTLSDFFHQEAINNAQTDTAILRFLPALKQALGQGEMHDAHRH